jgi:hypothetical protein
MILGTANGANDCFVQSHDPLVPCIGVAEGRKRLPGGPTMIKNAPRMLHGQSPTGVQGQKHRRNFSLNSWMTLEIRSSLVNATLVTGVQYPTSENPVEYEFMAGPGVDIVLLHDVAVSLSLMLKYIYYQLDATRNSHLSHTFDSILLKRLWLAALHIYSISPSTNVIGPQGPLIQPLLGKVLLLTIRGFGLAHQLLKPEGKSCRSCWSTISRRHNYLRMQGVRRPTVNQHRFNNLCHVVESPDFPAN